MRNNKSPGNDGLTKEFYETFWNERKRKKEVKYFSTSSRNQANRKERKR